MFRFLLPCTISTLGKTSKLILMARLASFTCTVDFAQPHATGIAFQIQKNRICPCVESIPCLELFECQFNKGKSSLRVHCSVFLPGGVFMQKNCKRRTGVIVSRRVQNMQVRCKISAGYMLCAWLGSTCILRRLASGIVFFSMWRS